MTPKDFRKQILKARNMERHLSEIYDRYGGCDPSVMIGYRYLINLYRQKRIDLVNDYKLTIKNATI